MRKWKCLLKTCISFGLLLLLSQLVDWREGVSVLSESNFLLMLLSLVLYPFNLLIGAWRWCWFLRPFGIRPTLRRAFFVYWAGAFSSNFLPSNIGGDLSRIYLFKNFQMTAQVTVSVIVERASGVLVALTLALAGLSLQIDGIKLPPAFDWIYWWGGSVSILLLGIIFWKGKFIFRHLENYFYKKETFFAQGFRKISKLYQALVFYRTHRKTLAVGVTFSVVYYMYTFLAHYILLRAIGVELDFLKIVFIVPWINLISIIPVTLNAYGLAEGAFVYFYSNAGLLPSQAFALALAARLIQIIGSSIGGVLMWKKNTF